ncbi:putative choline dehydrogenase [Annulohypoxylon stygium]|nr:putative choline dehydrogenase [Annulohypoxylon stygium]
MSLRMITLNGHTLLTIALVCLITLGTTTTHPKNIRSSENRAGTYDYVIVGGGAGGLTIASRLSENRDMKVAVVEAGTWPENIVGNQTQVPGYDYFYSGKARNQTNSQVEWGFETIAQAGINNQTIHYARGKALGGSTALNYMNYAFANKGALQMWAETVGDDSFLYNNAIKFYRKSLNYVPSRTTRARNATPAITAHDFSVGGPVDVTFSAYSQSWATWIAEAMTSVGIPKVNTFLNGNLMGSSWMPATISGTSGFRESSATAYLRPVIHRNNLHVYDLTLAERILFDHKKTATGVQVTSSGGGTFTLKARREVIISGGTFQSPQLLQVSGVGPADLLAQHKIPVVADRGGVGHGMQDHVLFAIAVKVNLETLSSLQYRDIFEAAVRQFNANQSGPLSSPGADYFGFEKLPRDIRQGLAPSTLKCKKAQVPFVIDIECIILIVIFLGLSSYPKDWPEVQFVAAPAYIGDEEYANEAIPHDGTMIASLLAILATPASRGNVRISSPNMRDKPLINPNWLTELQDKDVVVGAFKRIRQILASPALNNIIIGEEYYPGSKVHTDDQILAQIKKSFNTMFHAVSTCKMGRATDKYAVVDNHARVYGVRNLRVVDASIFPFLVPCVPQATVYMVAEKIADDIKRGY